VNILRRILPILVVCGMPAGAATLTYSASGTFSATTPTTAYSAPNQTWAFSFQMETNPMLYGSQVGVFFNPVVSNFTYTLNGSPVPVTPDALAFDNGAFDGGFGFSFALHPTFIALALNNQSGTGTQLYSGPESAPTMLTGTFTFEPTFAVGETLYPQSRTTIQVAPFIPGTPVPPSWILALIGLGCLAFYMAKRDFAAVS